MSPLEFGDQMGRLLRTYSDKAYPKERLDAIYARVARIPVAQFEKAVTYLIGENFTPPSVSKIVDACSAYREANVQMRDAPPAFNCEPCRDFGFGWVGETIVPCTCTARVGPTELVRQQANYDKGKRLMMNPKLYPNVGKPLPYNPQERL